MSDNAFLNKKSPFPDHLGMTVCDDGESVSLEVQEQHLNSHGAAHGGVIFTLADRAFGYSLNKHGKKAVTMEMKINYLSPVWKGDVIIARSKVVKEGKRTTVCLVEVKRGEENVAVLLGTAFNINK